jgi:hypothetical protein
LRRPIDLGGLAGYDSLSAPEQCLTREFIYCDVARLARAWTCAARTGADGLKSWFCRLFSCGHFAAKTAPSGTTTSFSPGRFTNPKKSSGTAARNEIACASLFAGALHGDEIVL